MKPQKFFGWEDYTVFAAMLLVSAGIGLYHGCKFRIFKSKKEQSEKEEEDSDPCTPKEFLTGNGQMGTFPVALSMLAR